MNEKCVMGQVINLIEENTINEEVIDIVFKVQTGKARNQPKGVFSSIPQNLVHQDFSSLSGEGQRSQPPPQSPFESPQEEHPDTKPFKKSSPKVGRNDPCHCGSGKKYKKCCGQ